MTGGGGFIGSHLTERLVRDGHEVRVLDNFATGRRENLLGLADDIELLEGDLQSYERVHNAVRGCEVVFHQGALPSVPRSVQDPLTSNATNVVGTLNVLLAARDAEVRRVVFASSSSVYGKNPALPKREDQIPLPFSPYAVAKLACEGYCRSFSDVYGLETVSLRYFNVFGPRQDPLSQYAAVVPRFITLLMEGRRPRVFGDGEQSRDFTYIGNVVDANLRAAFAADAAGEIFNVACGERHTVNSVLAAVANTVGRPIDVERAPARTGEVRTSVADIDKARRVLGYEPAIGLDEGLRITYEHFRADESIIPRIHERRRWAPVPS